jgi:hypothetical protein
MVPFTLAHHCLAPHLILLAVSIFRQVLMVTRSEACLDLTLIEVTGFLQQTDVLDSAIFTQLIAYLILLSDLPLFFFFIFLLGRLLRIDSLSRE